MSHIRPGIDFEYYGPHTSLNRYPGETWLERKARARWETGDDGATPREKRLLAAIRDAGWDVCPGIVNGFLLPCVLQRVEDLLSSGEISPPLQMREVAYIDL